MPDDTEDVVEAYSFNTGIFLYLPSVLDLGSGHQSLHWGAIVHSMMYMSARVNVLC